MKSIQKYCLLAAALLFVMNTANAEIMVKDTVSPEFIKNQGYSDEISRVISVKTIDPMTPIAKEENVKGKDLKWYMWKTIDPAVGRPHDWVNHNIEYNNSVNDL